MVKNGIFSKWIIENVPEFVFGSDKNLYKLPFHSGQKHYGLRLIKKQSRNRWKINGVWISERQLKARVRLNPNPEILISDKDLPF